MGPESRCPWSGCSRIALPGLSGGVLQRQLADVQTADATAGHPSHCCCQHWHTGTPLDLPARHPDQASSKHRRYQYCHTVLIRQFLGTLDLPTACNHLAGAQRPSSPHPAAPRLRQGTGCTAVPTPWRGAPWQNHTQNPSLLQGQNRGHCHVWAHWMLKPANAVPSLHHWCCRWRIPYLLDRPVLIVWPGRAVGNDCDLAASLHVPLRPVWPTCTSAAP
mmetsp:Transcript_9215/g.25767  ORF Transcript_9215/g.25767 Transcript_9215/m.25767 type:complete len:219 (-) Transcript_9215:397-1053(-)